MNIDNIKAIVNSTENDVATIEANLLVELSKDETLIPALISKERELGAIIKDEMNLLLSKAHQNLSNFDNTVVGDIKAFYEKWEGKIENIFEKKTAEPTAPVEAPVVTPTN